MATPYAVGVDNGGTWIRAVGLDQRGRRVWSLKAVSPPVQHLPRFLKQKLKRFRGQLVALAVGSRGVWKQAKRKEVKRALHGLAKRIVVMSDVEAAWLSAFRTQGIVVISGTGSIAYGRNAAGRAGRAGGFGPEKGDEGSGYWIGREWLRSQGRGPKFAPGGVRKIAALAPKVLAHARKGDPIANVIVRQAQWELAKIVKALARELRMNSVPLACAGSILQDAWFRKGFLRGLAPLRAAYRPARTDAATALAQSIMNHGRG